VPCYYSLTWPLIELANVTPKITWSIDWLIDITLNKILSIVMQREYSDWLRAGRSGDRILVGASFSASVQTGPGAHPASCTMGNLFFPGVKSGRGVTLTPHLLLVPWSRKNRAIPLLPLWAVRPVQSLSARTRVHFCNVKVHRCLNKWWTHITACS